MSPRPDVLVVTGDLADHGLMEEYAFARAWLELWPGPLAVCPRNHDVRQTFAEGLGVSSRSVVEACDLRFVMLDSLIDAVDGVRVDEGSNRRRSAGLARRATCRFRHTDVRRSPPPLVGATH